MALENNHDDFLTTDGIMVDKPMVAYPKRRPSLVQYSAVPTWEYSRQVKGNSVPPFFIVVVLTRRVWIVRQ
eukprot:scaffold1802_cov162-Chaetoceros_neogracile.AAC.3